MSRSSHIALITMFAMPFALLAASYDALPSDLPIIRIPLAHVIEVASKSLFTVYRVPFMNLTHGLMTAVMLSHGDDFQDARQRTAYTNALTTLLFAIAFKANFEAVQFSLLAKPTLSASYTSWAGSGTILSVVLGLGLAFAHIARAPIHWRDLRLPTRDRITLAALFAMYLGTVIASFLISNRA
jgi:hypothetical protein